MKHWFLETKIEHESLNVTFTQNRAPAIRTKAMHEPAYKLDQHVCFYARKDGLLFTIKWQENDRYTLLLEDNTALK